MRMSIVKVISCKWIMSAYDHTRSSPEIVENGFKKAGIVRTIKNGVEEITSTTDLYLDNDTIDSCDSD